MWSHGRSVAGNWRLPNIVELESLVNAERSNSATWLNSQEFTNVQLSYYWSATTHASYTDSAWIVYMDYVFVGSYYKTNDGYYVWPVRGGQSGSLGNLTISYPDGGETLSKATNYIITWQSTDITGTVQITLYKGGTDSADMVSELAAATDNDGQYTFNPTSSLEDGSDYYIGISAESGTVKDFSDSAFSIASVPDPACVSQKLKTASTLCTALMNCWVKEIKDVTEKYEVKNYTGVAIQKFVTGWGEAQDKAENKGLDCDAGSEEEIGEIINDAVEDIYEEISSDTDQGNKTSITLGSDLLKAAGKRCSSLLNARSAYLKDKTAKKDAKLSAAIAKADMAFANSFNKAKVKAIKKGLSCDDSIKTYLEGAIDDLESDILSGMGIPLP